MSLPLNPTAQDVVLAVRNLEGTTNAITFSQIAATLGLSETQLTQLVELAKVTTISNGTTTINSNLRSTTIGSTT